MKRIPVMWENDVLTVRELLLHTAEKYGDKPCIKYVYNNDVITKSYKKMCDDSFAVARYIRHLCPDRAHIAIIGKTDYKFITCFNGIFVSGNVAVPVAYDAGADELGETLRDADVTVLFYDNASADKAAKLKELCPQLGICVNFSAEGLLENVYEEFDGNSPNAYLSDVKIDPDDCTVIIYTSGTTGGKKGAMLSSRAVISNVYYKEMSFEGDHVTLNVLPMHHIFCFSCDYLKNLKDGVTVCLNGDLANIGANLLRFEPTVIRLVPMVIESLLRKVRILRKRYPELTPRQAAEKVFGRNLRNIIASGAYLGNKIAEEYEEMGITVRQGYGMTETGPRIAVPDGNTCAMSGGRVISTCDVRIKDGEIQVKSPSLMMGYYKKEAETDAVFTDDGWFKTGDMGRLTEDRELFITGRLKNVIILSNGENVSPEEIEKKYADTELINEIMVYADNDRIVAEVYPDTEYTEKNGISDPEQQIRDIINTTNARDAAAKEIDEIIFRSEPFPRTSTGKIKRKTVRY